MVKRKNERKIFKTISVNENLRKEFEEAKDVINGSIETNEQCLYKLLEMYKNLK